MSPTRSNETSQHRLIAALQDPHCYPHAVGSVHVIETHISWVLLAGRYAYKVKKALDLGFLDYSTLDARRACCEEEIRLNRRTAPGIYLDVVPIGGSAEQPVFGAHPAIEYAVRMRRFPADGLMDSQLLRGRVSARHIDSLAATIVRFHAALSPAASDSAFGTPASIRVAALQNFEQLRSQLPDPADRQELSALRHDSEAAFAGCRAVFEARRRLGFVRECHGDLHLGNIVLSGDEPVPFDCIEFNPALRWIDVMDEVAFTVMDLLYHDHPAFAWRLLNACLEANGDYAGAAVLRFYLAYRATVRAKVCAIRAGQEGIPRRARSAELVACRDHVALARRCLAQRRPVLIITHGLPGSGKTTFSQLALERLGAIRIRSDVERKRLFGLGPLASSRATVGDIYGSQATVRTYARLRELAHALLTSGFPVIVDAAFLRQDERDSFHRLAQDMSVPFVIATLQAGDGALRERLRQRRDDASEADVSVLEKLQAVAQALSPQELGHAARFTTEEAPDSEVNAQGWDRLMKMMG